MLSSSESSGSNEALYDTGQEENGFHNMTSDWGTYIIISVGKARNYKEVQKM